MTTKVRIDHERLQEMREREEFYRAAADRVNEIACDLVRRGVGFGDRKAFIGDVSREIGIPMKRFSPLLVHMNNLGWVGLARLDLPQGLPPEKVRDSEIEVEVGGARSSYGPRFHFVECQPPRSVKKNPSSPSSRAVEKFVEFHEFEPRETGTIPGLKIPTSVKMAGDAVHVMYRSDKWHEGRGDDYIHEHDRGVKVGRTGQCPGPSRAVPTEIQRVSTLVRIGRCLGVAYEDVDGNVVEMKPDGSVQLYCSPSGRALFVVDGVRVKNGRATFDRPHVEMILWGGRLGVEDRGIVH